MRPLETHPTFSPAILARCRAFTYAACAFISLVGFLCLLGWIFGIHRLRAPIPGTLAIKANTCIAMLLAGLALAVLLPENAGSRRTLLGKILALSVLAIGSATLSEHLIGWDLHIDQLLFIDPYVSPANPIPGRMGPPAATSFTLTGIALLLINHTTRRRAAPFQNLATLIGLISLLPLIGYTYSIVPLYNVSRYTIIAPHTAIALAVLALALLLARPDRGMMAVIFSSGPGGVMARRLILPAILIPFFLGWIRTLAERHNLIDQAFGRSVLILSLIVIFTTLVWFNARLLMRLGHQMHATQENLRHSEERFKVALQTAPVTVSTCDRDLRYTWVYGSKRLRPDQIIGRRDDELFPFQDFRDLMALKRRVLETGRGERGQIDVTIDGNRSFYEICAEPLRASDGSIAGVTAASMDITYYKTIEQDLLRTMADADEARKVAERANSAKDQFLAVLSHELRTPLTPVMTLVQLMEAESTLPQTLRDDLATIRRNVELEIKLIDDLLDLTRVTRGKLALHYEPVDVHEVLNHIVQSCDSDMRALRMQLTVELGAHKPTVQADAARLQQVLWNLLKNSVKFTPAGGHISLRTGNESDYVTITLQDNGIGIDPDHLPRIFDAFDQGNTAISRQFGGLGLGLAISKSIIEMHGGTITASSAGRGKGCTFRILLPTAKEGAIHAVTGGSAGGGDGENNILSELRILLVEDHPDTSKAMAQLLRSFGCRVRTSDTVGSALKAAEAEKFDVVMSDLGLPDGSGLDLMRQLLAKHNLKGIAVSGFGMDEDIRRSHQAGFKVHLTKPVNVKQLEQTLCDVASET